MNIIVKNIKQESISSLYELSTLADYSLLDTLVCDPGASATGEDYQPRQVFSGHYVPVLPTPIEHPEYVAHSPTLFDELGFDASLAQTTDFIRLFSGDVSHLPAPMLKTGWATGYALSIYGTEYIQQCPFQTGNGYGDGRAISVLEVAIGDKRWEMQLKGAGRTPYCRGADGRAVLRSSVREFLAQEHMHALDIPTSRSLSLFVSKTERVNRPWYFEGSTSQDPEVMVSNPVAISTRVASSFLRVGQIELFARRARNNAHPNAMKELEMIVSHLIDREYKDELDDSNIAADSLLSLAIAFRGRLTSLVTDWLRVGYCQGNFNSDNCAAGGYTLDYGPFGFCERFDPVFQPWTGGGRHFSFFNQPVAAEKNFDMFCKSLAPLLSSQPQALDKLESVRLGFADEVEQKMHCMWASKLGIHAYSSELFVELMELMIQTSVDYTIFFRELSSLPSDVSALHKSFYKSPTDELLQQWQSWFQQWHERIEEHCEKASLSKDTLSERMKRVNPKYTWREWLVAPAYQQAEQGDYALIKELQQVLTRPYDEQSKEIEDKFYQLRPEAFSFVGGITHYNCSS